MDPNNQLPNMNNQVPNPVQPPTQLQVTPTYESQPNTPIQPAQPISNGLPPVTVYSSLGQEPEKPKKSRGKKILRVLIALIILGGIVAAGYVYIPKLLSKYHDAQQAGQFKTLTQLGANISSSDVSKLNKTDLFFGVFQNASQQTLVRTKIGSYLSDTPNVYQAETVLEDTFFNYTTKQYSHQAATQGDSLAEATRCIGDQEYYFLNDDTDWHQSLDSTNCSKTAIYDFSVNDGLNSGGMTSAQAKTFVASLRATTGLINVTGLTLVKHDNKNYLRFAVTVAPVKTTDGYYGMQNFMWAFKDTQLDPSTQPYAYFGAIASGMKIAYYVDPATQLPVYSQLDTTAGYDDNGKPVTDFTYDYRHVEYQFGASVPTLDLKTHDPIQFSWPTDKL